LKRRAGSTQPATELLQSTLNPSEKRFFDALQTTPPTRATLTVTGRVAAGTIVLSVGIACGVLGAIVFGGLASVAADSS